MGLLLAQVNQPIRFAECTRFIPTAWQVHLSTIAPPTFTSATQSVLTQCETPPLLSGTLHRNRCSVPFSGGTVASAAQPANKLRRIGTLETYLLLLMLLAQVNQPISFAECTLFIPTAWLVHFSTIAPPAKWDSRGNFLATRQTSRGVA